MKTITLYGGEAHLEFDERKHAYVWKEKGLPVAGVTSILKILDKPALVQWAANMAVAHIQQGYLALQEAGEMLEGSAFAALCQDAKTAHRRFSRDAANIGSMVHAFAESVLVDGRATMPTDEKAAAGANAFLTWFRSHKIEPIHVERMVLSRDWYYAGTVDFFGRIDGELCVLDFKTSSGLYLEMLLQLAAYAVALTEETGEQINTGWIVRLDKKSGKCETYKIPLTNQVKDAWLRVREAQEQIHKLEESLDGLRKQAA